MSLSKEKINQQDCNSVYVICNDVHEAFDSFLGFYMSLVMNVFLLVKSIAKKR